MNTMDEMEHCTTCGNWIINNKCLNCSLQESSPITMRKDKLGNPILGGNNFCIRCGKKKFGDPKIEFFLCTCG